MTKEKIRASLDRVLTWPPRRQEEAVRLLAEMEKQDRSTLALTDEQAAEVERRLAEPHREFLTLEEVRSRFVRRPK